MKKLHLTILSALLALSAAACGGSNDGNEQAFLTIVGDKNVFLDNGDVQKLRVRYHDAEDRPLSGAVDFRLVGTTGGSTLSKSTAVTNPDGIVEIDLSAGQSGSANFTVSAEAVKASAARWTISVGNGVPDLDPAGRYELKSKLDLVSGLDNDVGNVLNTFLDMTDGANDPATWIIDQGVDALKDQGGVAEQAGNLIELFRGAIDPKVNEFILDNAPGFVTDIKEIGEALGDVTRNFGAITILDVEREGDDVEPGENGWDATHTLTGVYFDIRGTEYAYSMDAVGGEEITADGISVSRDESNMLVIGRHPMPLTYGNAIVLALEEGIIPLVDGSATDLNSFLQNRVDCEAFGNKVQEEVDINDSLAEGVCEFGIEVTAELIIDQLLKIDDVGIELDIEGVARPRDTNGDRKIDALQAGKWNGEIRYVGEPAVLDPEDNTFSGLRLGNTGTN